MKNVQHLPDFPMPPEFLAGGRSPFLYMHSGGRSQYRTVSHHFFFLTNTTVLHQALSLGWMVPDFNISLRWLQTSSTKAEGSA